MKNITSIISDLEKITIYTLSHKDLLIVTRLEYYEPAFLLIKPMYVSFAEQCHSGHK